MSWLILVLFAVLAGSSHIYIDNYISDFYFKGRHAVSQKLFFAFAFIIVAIILAMISGFDFLNADIKIILVLILSGICTSLAGIPYYKALEIDDSTNLGIFIQVAPVLYLVLGWLFLGESISLLQMAAFIVIMIAPALIVLSTRKRSRKVKLRAIFYAFLYVLISVASNLVFVKENSVAEVSFLGSMTLVMFGKGVGNLIIMMLKPKWIKRFNDVYKDSRRKVLRLLMGTLGFSLIKDFTYRGALLLAPSVALASAAADSAEPIVIFFMGIVLTLIWPKFGREKLNRKSVIVHFAATVLVVIGVTMLQF